MNEKYEKIINLPRHVSSKRAQMPREDRAAQFAPYSALSGYEDAVEETARLTDQKIELDEYEKEKINDRLLFLLSSPIPKKRPPIRSLHSSLKKQEKIIAMRLPPIPWKACGTGSRIL